MKRPKDLREVLVQNWLSAMMVLTARRRKLAEQKSVIPPEIARLRRTATKAFADAAIGLSCTDFVDACDQAATVAVTSGRDMVVCLLVLRDKRQYVIFPETMVPPVVGEMSIQKIAYFSKPPIS